jgi:tRNA G18 (ribose-2'-O)-methylase SpoU
LAVARNRCEGLFLCLIFSPKSLPMSEFIHQRHKPPVSLEQPRELVVVCAPLRSNVNFSRIVRAAGCCGVSRIVACGHAKIDPEIARIGSSQIAVEVHRTLPPSLQKLKGQGYALVGLEQTTNSVSIFDFAFPRRTALIVGNERQGLTDEVLAMVEHVVEIPVYGLPYAHNVATAAAIAMYEYCRQFPRG